MDKLTPVPGATVRKDEDGNDIVDVMTCGHCGRSWNDAAISGVTPVPSGRCPFEYEHEYPTWVVIENTPGYMPDNDDPATFEDLDAAKAYLAEEVERYCDFVSEGDGTPSVSWADDRESAHVVTTEHEHDLGRVFEIVQQEEEA